MKRTPTLAVLLALQSVIQAQQTKSLTVYVAPNGDDSHSGAADRPVKSLERAIEITRARGGGGSIHLSEGSVFRLAAPIQLDARDSGLVVVCKGSKAILSGGVPVTGWKTGDDGVWRAKCPIEGTPRELFVNGRRADRARFPNSGWLRIVETLPDRRSGFTVGAAALPDWLEPGNGLELVFLHDWSMSRIKVAAFDHETRTLRTAFPIGSAAPHYAIDHFEKQPRFALDGAASLIDAPGEWAFGGGEILYRPRDGEQLGVIDAAVPRLRRLVKIAPDADGKAPTNIRFEGVTFSHCRWDTPPQGYASGQATTHDWRDGSGKRGRTFIPAAVRVIGASGIAFSKVAFTNLGGSGLWIGRGARDCTIEGCEFSDISGNGINIGEQETEMAAKHIVVTESLVWNCGAQFYGSVGVWIGMAESCVVQRCEIRDLPYTGVSVGWRWNPTPSPCRKHLIADNHIHHVMQVLSDGGGVYTLGRQPGTVLRRNHIHDIPLNAGRAQSNGIFMDQGTTELLVESNVIHAVAKSPIRFHQAGENTIRGNTLGLREGAETFTFNRTDPKVIRFQENRVLSENSDELKAAVSAWKP